eukprot:CAMPEP_0182419824 /NCGR_PEP_ID=MMETSP1167-20130531/4183_1 /TAXON_ID=2988 /ORGANISM="Mallomonas Sp, Strain CCMP3275" /LENGTH=297 /DNA_ID=CAMNT_0024594933 /DNA_START=390 /DNA_END=1283 /DNA_ORIENTATION=+
MKTNETSNCSSNLKDVFESSDGSEKHHADESITEKIKRKISGFFLDEADEMDEDTDSNEQVDAENEGDVDMADIASNSSDVMEVTTPSHLFSSKSSSSAHFDFNSVSAMLESEESPVNNGKVSQSQVSNDMSLSGEDVVQSHEAEPIDTDIQLSSHPTGILSNASSESQSISEKLQTVEQLPSPLSVISDVIALPPPVPEEQSLILTEAVTDAIEQKESLPLISSSSCKMSSSDENLSNLDICKEDNKETYLYKSVITSEEIEIKGYDNNQNEEIDKKGESVGVELVGDVIELQQQG